MSPRQSFLAIGLIVAAAMLATMLGLLVGAKTLSVETALRVLLAPDGKLESVLVWTLRLPRSLAAAAGAPDLPFPVCAADADAQSAGRSRYYRRNIGGGRADRLLLRLRALAFACLLSLHRPCGGPLAASVTFWVSRGGQGRPLQLALGGVSVSLFLGAITTYVLLLTGPQSASLLFWLAGGFQGRTWSHLLYMLPWTIAGVVGALVLRRVIGMFMLSDHAAAGMGLQLGLWKPLILILAVIPVAGVAPIAGPVAFVGLAAPHIARLLKPRGTGWEIGLSASLGALIVTVADVLARSVAIPRELPVGIVTALLGGPVFIYLVQRGRLSFAGETQ